LLLDRISVGGMAEVFKAKSYGVEGFEKIIAIKRILPTMGEDRDFIKMFIDEAKIAGQLAHANICQIFELGRIDGSHFIAMEYIWGKDLLQIANRLRKVKQAMPIQMASFVIAKVLEGLDYAHRKRDPLGRPLEIVHRDCSPQNVLVSYEGEVKVIDFGIAKATSRNSRTMAGVLKGKFGYMSPEQVRGLPLDRRSDIFAIGTMLYECLTGERLFQGETDFSTLEKVRNVDIAAPRAVNPAIPEAIEKVILKALSKDVEDRYQWCSEMLADLQAYLMSQDVVFTAKSLSGWLKDVFAQEIERERQLLEQYKRVGRDGLIAGVPSAQAKLDVNENLGEAGMPEGDATMLGGPNFEDVEKDTGAAPDVHQSPAAGGPRGSVQKKGARAQPAYSDSGDDEEGEGDFGEEAPTEIFGDAETPQPAAQQPAAGRAPSVRDVQQPIGQMGQMGKPPLKPPGRPSTERPAMPSSQPPMATAAMRPAAMQGHEGLAAAAGAAYHPNTYPQPMGTPPAAQPAQMIAMGTPGAMEQQASGLAPVEGPQRTVLGVQAPPGMGNYGQPQQYRPSGQQAAQQSGGMPMHNPHVVQQNPQYPGYAQPQGYPGYPQQGYSPQGYPQQYGAYPSGPMPMGATPLDQAGIGLEGKRSTLVRDIGIGVGIAALVLVGFLVVKMVVLDGDSKPTGSAQPTSKFATVKLSMPAGIAAEMFVDGDRVATVTSESPGIPVSAGTKHIKLVGTNGLSCDDPKVKLEAGKTTTLECNFGLPGRGSASGSAGSAAATGSAGAAPQVAAAGSGDAKTIDKSADTKATDTKTSDTKSSDTKSSDTKASDTKASDTKSSDTKSSDTKSSDTKSSDSKSSDSKKTDRSSDAKKTDTTDTKSTDTKVTDTKKTDTKVADTKIETKAAGDPSKGYLQVFSKPPAKILIDGNDTGLKTPISGQALGLDPGKHKITFVIGDDRFTYPVIIKAGVTDTMSKDLQ
jgi:serine/threonine protein kinase